jgi:flagellar hook-associated protein 2
MSSVSAVNTLLSGTATTTPAISISSILAASAGTSTPGIDVTAAVAAAIYADRAPERAWQDDQTTLTSQTTALTSIQTATEALATDMQSLNTLTGPLAARTVASSNSNDLTATAATGTTTGTHTVVVNALASTGSWYSSMESSPTAPLPTSSMTLIPASGKSVTFQTGATTTGDTLADLAKAINTYTDPTTKAGLGVTATIVSDSTGSRLAIVSSSSGAAADFSVAEPYTTWTATQMSSAESLGANSLVLSTAAGTKTIATTSGESYATLANAINNAKITTSYDSTSTTLTNATPLTAGSVTTIQDNNSGSKFVYTAVAGNTVGTLNTAIAAAVKAGTLSANVTGAINTSGQEVISEASTDQGITVSTNDATMGAINADPLATKSLGLTATATTDSSGNTNLTIANTTGSTPFTVSEPSASGSAFSFTQAVQGTNASLTVDGVPIQSASNTVTGAIPGVTLDLLGAAPGSPISLTVASDASAVSIAINQFVSDYNTALGLVTTQFSVDKSTNSQGVLGTDPTVVSLQSTLEQALNYVNTPATGTTTVSMLSDLGITANKDTGALSVDSATLDNALTNNPSDVQNFFEGAALNGFANFAYNQLNAYTSPANGAFKVDLSSNAATYASLTSQINDFEAGYIASQQSVLNAEFSRAEIALQQLPQEMAQLNAELGLTSKSNG